jgi:hypothetical protein
VSAKWRADDAPAYPQTDEEADLRAELLELHARMKDIAVAHAEDEIDIDGVRAANLKIKPRLNAIEAELGMALSFQRLR